MNFSSTGTKRILLIAGEPRHLEPLREALDETALCEFFIANTGRSGLELFFSARFDLIVVLQPVSDLLSAEVIRRIHAFSPHLPVVLVVPRLEEITTAFSAGAHGVLNLPVDPVAAIQVCRPLLEPSSPNQ